MNLYVGNLSYEATEDDLRQAFSAFGNVANVSVIKDKFTNKSRGFAFVEMASDAEGNAAVEGMNGKDVRGRPVKVNVARERTEGDRPRGGGFRGGRNGGGGFHSGSRDGGY